MNSKIKIPLSTLCVLLLIPAAASSQPGTPAGWDTVAAILQSIVPPAFPAKDWRLTAFGADSLGVNDCTNAFRAAIDSCTKNGGGRVVVPAGTYLSGPIVLKSNVNLYVAEGATIKFSTSPAKYLPVVYTRFQGEECMNYSPLIYAYGQQNIAVTGSGILDGQATDSNWWSWKSPSDNDSYTLDSMATLGTPVAQRIFGAGHYLRPPFFQSYQCSNVLVQGVTFKDSPMWFLNPVLCQNVSVLNVIITTNAGGSRPNTDGCDPECCTNVLIRGCSFTTGDDCIAIKSGKKADGRRVNVPCSNIIVQNCKMQDGHGGITVGSEMTGGVRNVFADHDTLSSANLQYALRFKTNTSRGGVIENFYARGLLVNQVSTNPIYVTFSYSISGEYSSPGTFVPAMRNLFIDSMTCLRASSNAISIHGLASSKANNIVITNSTFTNMSSNAIDTQYVSGLVFNNVKINGKVYTAVDDGADSPMPRFSELLQNHPNPFNPATVIGYRLTASGAVTLKVYDVLGREVETLVHETQTAGFHQVRWTADGLTSGMYFYRLQTGEVLQARKMSLLK